MFSFYQAKTAKRLKPWIDRRSLSIYHLLRLRPLPKNCRKTKKLRSQQSHELRDHVIDSFVLIGLRPKYARFFYVLSKSPRGRKITLIGQFSALPQWNGAKCKMQAEYELRNEKSTIQHDKYEKWLWIWSESKRRQNALIEEIRILRTKTKLKKIVNSTLVNKSDITNKSK